jgi:hypothetical protein
MKANAITNCVVAAAICVSVAAPLMAWRSSEEAAQARDESLRKQKLEIDTLTTANASRKQELAAKNAGALTDEQMRELLRLRAEAGALRKQTNDLERWQAQNARLGAADESPPAERDAFARQLSGELSNAAKNIVAELPAAQRKFAEEHQGASAKQLSELRKYFPNANGRRMPGLYSFDFVRDEGPQPGDTLILGESGEHPTPGGPPGKFYAFSDGQVVEVKAPTVEDAYKFFEEWEKEHLSAVPSQGQ